MHRNLRSFLELLRRERDIVAVEAEVDPYLELSEIHRRVISRGGPAVLFRKVKGSPSPVGPNPLGTVKRIELAFGAKPEALVRRAAQVAESLLPPRPSALWRQRSLALEALRLGTRRVRRAPVAEVLDRPARLDELPVLTTWQEDGGPFFTLPLVYTEHPSTRRHNLGVYRMQRFDASTTGMHWQIHKGGGFHYHEAEAQTRRLPVTVFLGGPAALILSAVAPLPEDVPELVLASVLAGEKIRVVENPLPADAHRLVAESEFALVGRVPPRERRAEGPFGDHYGYYSLRHDYPVFHVDAVFHRKDAIYPATVVGKPRQEDFFIGDYLQKLLSPLFPLVMPSVRDLWTYGETGFHPLPAAVTRAEVFCPGCLVVQGSPFAEDPEQAARLAREEVFKDWPLVVLHDDASVARSTIDFLWATWTRFEPAADIHAAETDVRRQHISYRAPLVIDARMKPGYPDELVVRPDIAELVGRRWREYFPSGVE